MRIWCIIFAARRIPAVIGGGFNVGYRKLVTTYGADVRRAEFDRDVYAIDGETLDDYHRPPRPLEQER
jgi:hypothetical protein